MAKNRKKRIHAKNKKAQSTKLKIKIAAFVVSLSAMALLGYFLREKIAYLAYVYFASHTKEELRNSPREQHRIDKIISANSNKMFGIDLSHYQRKEDINWDSLNIGKGAIPIKFVMMRATMGTEGRDKNFAEYWRRAKQAGLIRGAYHFYRADEDPVRQANNYLEAVKLEDGDFVPIIDIEKIPKRKSNEQLLSDLKIITKIFEETFDKKPIIYTYAYYYKDFLQNDFDDYPLWLANYNDVDDPMPEVRWQIWQFTESGIITGVNTKIDIDIFDNPADYHKYLISGNG